MFKKNKFILSNVLKISKYNYELKMIEYTDIQNKILISMKNNYLYTFKFQLMFYDKFKFSWIELLFVFNVHSFYVVEKVLSNMLYITF